VIINAQDHQKRRTGTSFRKSVKERWKEKEKKRKTEAKDTKSKSEEDGGGGKNDEGPPQQIRSEPLKNGGKSFTGGGRKKKVRLG